MAEDKKTVSQDQQQAGEADEDRDGGVSIVSVEDAGPLRKKVTLEVSREQIDSKFDENFTELSSSAAVPGFRIGRAPRKLIEKRFGKDVQDQVRLALISQAVEYALTKGQLKTIGEPDFDLEKVELPDQGQMSFSFEVEVRPEFDLPELKAISITRPTVEVTQKDIDEQMESLRWRFAQLEPAGPDAKVQENDRIIADLKTELPDKEPTEESRISLDVHAQSIAGIPFPDMVDQLKDMTVAQDRQIVQAIPDDYSDEPLRGKEVKLTVSAREIHRWKLPELDGQFFSSLGVDNLDQLRTSISTQLEAQKGRQVRQGMEEQVRKYLLDNTKFDIPATLAQRQESRAVMRRVMELVKMGVPRPLIEKRMDQLRAGARDQVITDIKMQFVAEQISELLDIQVSEEETNGAIAQMAVSNNRRPERLREEMIKDGSYESVSLALKETKVLNKLIEDANISEKAADKDSKGAKSTKAAKSTKGAKGSKGTKGPKPPAKSDTAKKTNAKKSES